MVLSRAPYPYAESASRLLLPPYQTEWPLDPYQTIRILLIDDDQGDFEITRVLVSKITRTRIELDWVSSYEEGIDALQDQEHDVYLVDYYLEDQDGLKLVREAREMGIRKPMIMLTGRGSHAVDVEAMKAGASDYLVKGKVDPDAQGEFKRSSQHLRKEEELRWRQASADGRIELCVRRWVHPVVPRWGAGSIGRGFGKKLLEGCRARSRRWQPACLPLLGRAGFANVVACHLSVFVLCRGATYRSSSEKRLRFFKPAVVAYVRSPSSCAAHRRRSRENCGGTQQREVETSSIEPRPLNGMPIGERSVRKLPNSLRTAN